MMDISKKTLTFAPQTPIIAHERAFVTRRNQNWKDAGVVDRGGLENRCSLTGTQGSNPCLSAKKEAASQRLVAYFFVESGMRIRGFVIAKRFRSEAEKESLSFRNLVRRELDKSRQISDFQ